MNTCCQDNHDGNRVCIEKINKVTDNVIINQANNECNMNSTTNNIIVDAQYITSCTKERVQHNVQNQHNSNITEDDTERWK